MYRCLAAILLLAGAPTAPPPVPSLFAAILPEGVGDVSRWEIVSGSFETRLARGAYIFYVNPSHSAMYQLMRYSVELRKPASPAEERRGAVERVAFVRRPGAPQPMACWERVAGPEPQWREIAPGTEAYVLEMSVLIRVLEIHRAARTASSR